MPELLRLNHSDMSDEVQLELLAPWYTQRPSESRTLDFFDAIPKYPFPTTTTIHRAERIQTAFTLRGKHYVAEILPAQIKNANTGQEQLMFAGAREELVERALRFIAVQQIAKTKLTADVQTGRHAVTVFFSLSMLRRHLEQLGHGYKLSEIKEALDILADTRIAVEEQTIEAKTGRQRRTRDFASILTHYTASTVEEDTTGEEAYVAMTFHPAATAAILQLAFYPINQLRVGKLKRPLARWLTTRMSHNYRQAKRNGWIDGDGYHISLETILAERGLVKEKRLRDNVDSVRAGLAEMKREKILYQPKPYDENLTLASGRGGRKIVGAVWTLYPSHEFVEEIIRGNEQMLENKELGSPEPPHANAGDPQLWDSTNRGK
jgi:hypothetical protein